MDWLRDTTEKFCKDRDIHGNLGGIQIIDGKDKNTQWVSVEMLSNVVSFFRSKSWSWLFIETKDRFDFYKKKEELIT